ncbi:hypothetical protein HNQ02_000355 [Flavobacterium sp. 7E]|uniref:hypothetical protein n=1 Tax=Flavobacterium sp. 7E TaxID=2735898 RepID=UPI00156FDEB6|nr:hypothetical protein [Flavobacterium sp. 7E]NRS87455.1 hypothetical protein [Flavobacterium sp. 7E]
MFVILCDAGGFDLYIMYKRDNDIIKIIKRDLLSIIDKTEYSDLEAGVNEFDRRFQNNKLKEIPLIIDLKNIFDSDLSKSIFNQLDIQQANERGELFFNEYLDFHGLNNTEETPFEPKKEKPKYKLPEINFD